MPGASDGRLMMGMMIRVMRFHSSLRWIGITGWTFKTQTVRFSGPVLKLKLFWNGTLIRSATGFCVFFARSVLLSSFPLVGAAACSAWSGLARRTANINTAHRLPSRPTTLQDRVAQTARALLVAGVRPHRAVVARRLGMSQRSLQRGLEAEGTTFRAAQESV